MQYSDGKSYTTYVYQVLRQAHLMNSNASVKNNAITLNSLI